MKKNSKYIVIGTTLLGISFALLVVASAATSTNNCNTCTKSMARPTGSNAAFARTAVSGD